MINGLKNLPWRVNPSWPRYIQDSEEVVLGKIHNAEQAKLIVACVNSCSAMVEACDFASAVSQVDNRTRRIAETAIVALEVFRSG